MYSLILIIEAYFTWLAGPKYITVQVVPTQVLWINTLLCGGAFINIANCRYLLARPDLRAITLNVIVSYFQPINQDDPSNLISTHKMGCVECLRHLGAPPFKIVFRLYLWRSRNWSSQLVCFGATSVNRSKFPISEDVSHLKDQKCRTQ